MRRDGGIEHVLARHVEGASHMADGYTRTRAGNIGVCVGTSGPAGTDMITGLYAAAADSVPILAITGQAPVARLHKEDFQAVDIATIAAPVTKMAVTVLEAAQVPGVFQKAFHLMRSGRPGPVLIDLPFDVQMTEIEFDVDTYAPLEPHRPAATRAQVEKALDMLQDAAAPLIVAGGGIINADASDLLVELAELLDVPVVPTLMGWGAIPDDHRLMAGMVGPADVAPVRQRHVPGVGLRARHRQPVGQPAHRRAGPLPRAAARSCTSTSSPRRSAGCSRRTTGSCPTRGRPLSCSSRWPGSARGGCGTTARWVEQCAKRKLSMLRRTHFDNVPMKPQRVYEEMNRTFGRDTRYVSTIGLSQIAGGQFLHVFGRGTGSTPGQAGPLGWTLPAALGVVAADPDTPVVALSGDYDFQFMIEELAVGAQFNLPYIHVVVNNSYLGLIRQSQRGSRWTTGSQLAFDNVNTPRARRATASTT